jgi:hypothetical protein
MSEQLSQEKDKKEGRTYIASEEVIGYLTELSQVLAMMAGGLQGSIKNLQEGLETKETNTDESKD